MIATIFALSLSAFAQAEEFDQISVGPRFSLPGGEAAGGVDWKNVLKTGIGVEARYAHLWKAAPATSAGIFFSFEFDSFSGKSTKFTDPTLGPVTIKPDSLEMFALELGGRVRQHIGPVFADLDVGFGMLLYSKTDADISSGPNTVSVDAIGSSTTYMAEVGGRVCLPVSQTGEVAVGARYQVNGRPDTGSGFNTSFKGMGNAVLVLSFNLNF